MKFKKCKSVHYLKWVKEVSLNQDKAEHELLHGEGSTLTASKDHSHISLGSVVLETNALSFVPNERSDFFVVDLTKKSPDKKKSPWKKLIIDPWTQEVMGSATVQGLRGLVMCTDKSPGWGHELEPKSSSLSSYWSVHSPGHVSNVSIQKAYSLCLTQSCEIEPYLWHVLWWGTNFVLFVLNFPPIADHSSDLFHVTCANQSQPKKGVFGKWHKMLHFPQDIGQHMHRVFGREMSA